MFVPSGKAGQAGGTPRAVALLAAIALLASSHTLRAHEVDHTITREGAVVVHLDEEGVPFAQEAYQIYRPGEDTPFQTGRTDVRGRVAFVPDRPGAWRVRAFSEDGHGVDLVVPVDEVGAERATSAANGGLFSGTRQRLWGIATGVVAILVLFALLWVLYRRRATI